MANGETRGKRALPGKRGEGLFALHSLVENHLASLFHVDDAMNGFVTERRNIKDVIAGTNHELSGRSLVQHAPVHGDLRPFGLGLDANGAHPRRVAAAEDLFEFTHGLDVICVAEWSKGGEKW